MWPADALTAYRAENERLKAELTEQADEVSKLRTVYTKCLDMLCHLGLEGEIHNQHSRVLDLYEALEDYDDGQNKTFPDPEIGVYTDTQEPQ